MEAKKINTYKNVFYSLRNAIYGLIVALIFTIIAAFYYSFQVKKDAERDVWVVTNYGTFQANRVSSLNMRTNVEIRAFFQEFLARMYSYDANTYEKNVKQAFELISQADGQRIYRELNDVNLLQTLRKTSVRTEASCNQMVIAFDEETNIYSITGTFKQVIYGARVQDLPYKFEGKVQLIDRSDNNPFGLLLFDFYTSAQVEK